jgi:hypothetical protein
MYICFVKNILADGERCLASIMWIREKEKEYWKWGGIMNEVID